MALLSLGWFVFQMDTAPFETLKRSVSYRWANKDRVNAPAARQYLGKGEDTITIEGRLYPGITGSTDKLDKLREMGESGKVWILTAGTGEVLGRWTIDKVDETRDKIVRGGIPRRVVFTLSLSAYADEDDPSVLGNLHDSLP